MNSMGSNQQLTDLDEIISQEGRSSMMSRETAAANQGAAAEFQHQLNAHINVQDMRKQSSVGAASFTTNQTGAANNDNWSPGAE